jgi:hypothetical protein
VSEVPTKYKGVWMCACGDLHQLCYLKAMDLIRFELMNMAKLSEEKIKDVIVRQILNFGKYFLKETGEVYRRFKHLEFFRELT